MVRRDKPETVAQMFKAADMAWTKPASAQIAVVEVWGSGGPNSGSGGGAARETDSEGPHEARTHRG